MATPATTLKDASEVTVPGLEGLDLPEAPGAGDADQPAPVDQGYGLKADGTPKRKPGRPAGSGRRRAAAGPRAVPPPRKPGPKRAPAKTQSPYVNAVAGPLQMLGAALVISAQQSGSAALLADAAAIGEHTPAIAQALADVADQDDRVAAVLDRLAQVGPWGAVITALIPLTLQIAANHGVAAAGVAGAMFGVKPPQELVDKMLRDQQRFTAAWEAQEAADAEWAAAEMAAAQDARV